MNKENQFIYFPLDKLSAISLLPSSGLFIEIQTFMKLLGGYNKYILINYNENNDELFDQSKFFVNLTNQQIPDEIEKIVRVGPKYSSESFLNKKMAFGTIKNTEHLLSFSAIPDDVKNFIRYDIIQDVRSSINESRPNFFFELTFWLITFFRLTNPLSKFERNR